jgi:hypothetical protein
LDLLEKRNTLKLDFDSYNRRANAELAKDSTGSSSSSKIVMKRDNAALKLKEITKQIRDHLESLEKRRPSMLVSELSALIGIQHSIVSRQSDELSELLPAVPHSAVTICSLAHAASSQGHAASSK